MFERKENSSAPQAFNREGGIHSRRNAKHIRIRLQTYAYMFFPPEASIEALFWLQSKTLGANAPRVLLLFLNSSNVTGANCSSAFADREGKTLLHSDWSNKFNIHIYVIAGHTHFNAFR